MNIFDLILPRAVALGSRPTPARIAENAELGLVIGPLLVAWCVLDDQVDALERQPPGDGGLPIVEANISLAEKVRCTRSWLGLAISKKTLIKVFVPGRYNVLGIDFRSSRSR